MLNIQFIIVAILLVIFAVPAAAQQRPGQPGVPPGPGGMKAPRRPGVDGPMRPGQDGQPRAPRAGGWFEGLDANRNGTVEKEEYLGNAEGFFRARDVNSDGVLDGDEKLPPPPPEPREPGQNAPRPANPLPPPQLVMAVSGHEGPVTKAEFDQIATRMFAEWDRNSDNVLTRQEVPRGDGRRGPGGPEGQGAPRAPRPGGPPPPDSPTAKFIGAELRFGDKLVKDVPFSAETVMESSRRLYDGTTVTKQNKGAIYRDTAGRTRREQPLEAIGGFGVVGENNQPLKLIFINDFVAGHQLFIDSGRKAARLSPLGNQRPPMGEPDPKDGKVESLGTKTIEGVTVEGTRITREIPAGQIGNDKPLTIVHEKWFSPELQTIIYSRHLDPIAGEQIFRLVNIRKGEPSADLFTAPSGYRIEGPARVPKRED